MRIVEEDFIIEPANGLFDLILLKKVKNKETGEISIKEKKSYGCSLASCIKRVIRFRTNTKFESESMYLLEALKEMIELEKEIISLCKEPQPEDFDTGE